ncbi:MULTISPECIES: hypothetical protein [Sphingobacterium]|uniref:Uncharacterized protein n=1 Tax=Sphingobacterium tenebrionis TaxID=3111775 RepID=A0ABU8I907_9SPHI|nr:hypothetical protein [Sphingobacterium sp. CZ-2]QBR11468.1 hypothetical protein E3D81_04480 [Sphingobacterium sp. CZ-2]
MMKKKISYSKHRSLTDVLTDNEIAEISCYYYDFKLQKSLRNTNRALVFFNTASEILELLYANVYERDSLELFLKNEYFDKIPDYIDRSLIFSYVNALINNEYFTDISIGVKHSINSLTLYLVSYYSNVTQKREVSISNLFRDPYAKDFKSFLKILNKPNLDINFIDDGFKWLNGHGANVALKVYYTALMEEKILKERTKATQFFNGCKAFFNEGDKIGLSNQKLINFNTSSNKYLDIFKSLIKDVKNNI